MKRLTLNKFILFFVFMGACARAPIKNVDQAMRPAVLPLSEMQDDLGLFDLAGALQKNIERLSASAQNEMRFGPITISKEDYISGLEMLVLALYADSSGSQYFKTLQENFEFYEVYGNENWGEVFITSYYEPVIQGSLKKKKPFTQPLYGIPKDMVTVEMGEFAKAFPNLRPYQQAVIEQQSREGILRGRILRGESVVPYFTRQEIDQWSISEKKPDERVEVICYVDPIDAFFLQIQGSGRVLLPDDSEIKIGYASQNGHPYKPIGKLLFEVIPKESMSMQKIEAHLRSLPEEEARKIMQANPSYVFFQKREAGAIGSFGAEVVSGRTIATDQKYFPKGALAYMEYSRPQFETSDSQLVKEFSKSSRFVLDQDTGGAIRGPGRVDLFWGQGSEAAKVSGVMRGQGRLYYILPKKKKL